MVKRNELRRYPTRAGLVAARFIAQICQKNGSHTGLPFHHNL